jgi:hypothetical protein
VPASQGLQRHVDHQGRVLQNPLHFVADRAFKADIGMAAEGSEELGHAVHVIGAATLVDSQNVHC